VEIFFAPATPALQQQLLSLVRICLSELGRLLLKRLRIFQELQPNSFLLIQKVKNLTFEELMVMTAIGSTPPLHYLLYLGFSRLFFFYVQRIFVI